MVNIGSDRRKRLKEIIRNQIKEAVIWAGNNPLVESLAHAFHKNRVIFIAYHGVVRNSEELEAWTLVKESSFRQQIKYLKENFDCLSIEEALYRNAKGAKKPGVVVTFDDGYANNVEIALPILEEFGIPATIYISTEYVLERRLFWPDTIWIAAKYSRLSSIDLRGIASPLRFYELNGNGERWLESVLSIIEDLKKISPDRRNDILRNVLARFMATPGAKKFQIEVENNVFTPLSEKQVRQLSCEALVTIAAHSHCHNLLDQISLDNARESMRRSKEILESLTGRKIEHFAYPNGNFNEDLARVVQGMGFKSAVTFRRGFFKPSNDPYTINRLGVGSDTTFDLFKALLTGIFEFKTRLMK